VAKDLRRRTVAVGAGYAVAQECLDERNQVSPSVHRRRPINRRRRECQRIHPVGPDVEAPRSALGESLGSSLSIEERVGQLLGQGTSDVTVIHDGNDCGVEPRLLSSCVPGCASMGCTRGLAMH
jgi:hypothetical protein